MKQFIFFCVVCFQISLAFEIEVDYGVEENKPFSIITLKHDKKFQCKDYFDIHNKNILIECIINKTPSSSFPKNRTEFFEIYTEIKNNQFHLFIKPKKSQRLFANAFDLKKDLAIPKERPKESKIWQIIGYDNEIPFLSNHSYLGLNFPINIPKTTLPYIKELNIDASPLIYDEGPDLAIFLNIKKLYEENRFEECIVLIDEILQKYPNSIFKRESLLYKLRALNHNPNIPEDMIDLAKIWIKSNPADINVPEVLYLLGNSYSKLKIYNEAKYYFNRILEEYDTSKYAQYALVGLAKNLFVNGEKKQPENLYTKAYSNAKDLDTASYVSLEWGKYELKIDNPLNANEIFGRVVKNNPSYFLKNPKQSYKDFKLWASYKLYENAAKAGNSMLENLPNDEFKQQLMNDISLWYEASNHIEDAHRINAEFLALFKDSQMSNAIKQRDDNLLFSLNENDIEKQIQQYDYIIKTYPDTDNAKLAYEKKAKNLFTLGRYEEVITLKNHLAKDDDNVKNAYIKLITSSKNCNEMMNLFLQSNQIPITANAKNLFECLFDASLFKQAKDLSNAILTLKPNNKKDNFTWLYNEARANFAIDDFNKAITASRDAFTLASNVDEKIKVGALLFLSFSQENRKNEAINLFDKLIKISTTHYEMLKVYHQMLLWAINDNDYIAIQNYAKQIIAIQKQTKTYEYSPFVELSYADVLFRENRFTQMLSLLENLKSNNTNELQKIKYMRGVAYNELGKNTQAKKEFQECVALDSTSHFASLCKDAK